MESLGQKNKTLISRPPQTISELKHGLEFYFGKDRVQFNEKGSFVIWGDYDRFLVQIKSLKDQFDFIFLADIAGVDNKNRIIEKTPVSQKCFEINYFLINLTLKKRATFKIQLNLNQVLPSVSSLWKGSSWQEKELWDLLGVPVEGQTEDRLFNVHNFNGHPLRKDYEFIEHESSDYISPLQFTPGPSENIDMTVGREWFNLGPFQSGINGPIRVMVELEQQKVTQTKVEVGLCHKGWEKLCEGKTYHQILALTGPLNPLSSGVLNLGWCKAIEEFMAIKVPERAMAQRMVLIEFSRILDHLHLIGSLAFESGQRLIMSHCLEQKEIILFLFEELTGARVNVNWGRIGGMAYSFPDHWVTNAYKAIKKLKKGIHFIQVQLKQDPDWLRWNDFGRGHGPSSLNWGVTGPCLRACGINYDVRKDFPYYFYDQVDFEIPLGIKGNPFDRFAVRMEETLESIKIIRQILDYMPPGPIINEEFSPNFSMKGKVSLKREELLKHFKFFQEGIRPPAGEIYSFSESAGGELGFFIVSDGSPRPYRVKMRSPSMGLVQSFPDLVKGGSLNSAICNFGSLNIVPSELDR